MALLNPTALSKPDAGTRVNDGPNDSQQTPQSAAHGQAAVRTVWRIHVAACPDRRWAGRVAILPQALCNLGRDVHGAHDLGMDDGALSRNHASLQVTSAGVEVRDRGSRNGTYIAGRKLKQALVGHGAVLRFGDTVAVLESDSGDAELFDQPTAHVPGWSEVARRVRWALDMAARDLRPTLLCGDTGTGKEYAATELHQRAGRFGRLVRVNVAAIPEPLFEAHLFGHAKGAFTGAAGALTGLVREADGGTLVLDEIGELALPLQAKLLRLLEDNTVRPVGGGVDLPVQVRFVCTTNADLTQRARAGLFRADLLGRLQAHRVVLPPLAARRPDLMALADAVAPLAPPGRLWRTALDARAVERLLLAEFPFNLRSLQAMLVAAQQRIADGGPPGEALERSLQEWNAVAAAAAEAQPSATSPRSHGAKAPTAPPLAAQRAGLPAVGAGGTQRYGEVPALPAVAPPPAQRWRPDAELLRRLLTEHHGSIEHVAQALGRDRRQVYRWLQYAGINESELRTLRGGER